MLHCIPLIHFHVLLKIILLILIVCQHEYITICQKILPFSEPTPESFSLRNILMVPKRKEATNTMMVDLLAKFGVDACKTSLEFISPPPVITFFRRGLSKLIKKPAK